MAIIRGRQLIYTRVEEQYSPKGISGFQVFYASAGLIDKEIDQIKERVSCYQPKPDTIKRKQFFSLESGRIVVTQSTGGIIHRQIIDPDARKNIFLAHCLIFEPEEFAITQNNPFIVFDHFRFLEDPELMIMQYNQVKGQEPECIVDFKEYAISQDGEDWQDQILDLLALIPEANNKKTTDKEGPLLIQGSEEECESFLRAIFRFAEKKSRLLCSFDTWTENCGIPFGRYWAIGSLSASSQYRVIQTSSHHLPEGKELPESIYVTWIKQKIKNNEIAEIITYADQVQEISEAFTDKRNFDSQRVSEFICESVWQVDSVKFLLQIETVLATQLSPILAKEFLPSFSKSETKPRMISYAIKQHINYKTLSSRLRTWIKENPAIFERMETKERRKLLELANKANDPILTFWMASGLKIDKSREDALQSMSAEQYTEALALLCHPIMPELYITEQYHEELAKKLEPFLPQMTDEDFLSWVKLIIAHNGQDSLGIVSSRIRNLDEHSLTRLEKQTKNVQLPSRFRKAITDRRLDLGVAPNIVSTVKYELGNIVSDFRSLKRSAEMKWLGVSEIYCPYCMGLNTYRNTIELCGTCKQPFPLEYRLKYEETKLFFIQLLGWSRTGKSVYLNSLTLMLDNLSLFFPSCASTALTERTQKYLEQARAFRLDRGDPGATQMIPNKAHANEQAYIMEIENMLRWGSRTAVIRDVPGEVFDKTMHLAGDDRYYYFPYLLTVPTTLLMISLDILKKRKTSGMQDLLNEYIRTLLEKRVNLKDQRRNVIVVFTKADQFENELPANLKHYLRNDPFAKKIRGNDEEFEDSKFFTEKDLQEYLEGMQRASKEICGWICNHREYRNSALNMLSRAENNNINMVFSMISSTGQNLDEASNTYIGELALARVLDPFFWAIELQSSKQKAK